MVRIWFSAIGLFLVSTSVQAQDNPASTALSFDIQIQEVAGDVRSETRTVTFGADWVRDEAGDEIRVYDFNAFEDGVLNEDSGHYNVVATHAAARENIDIYAALSNNGQLTTINFGDAGSFHRFWLESALDVRAQQAELTVSDNQDTRTWSFNNEPVVRARFADCYDGLETPVSGLLFSAWYRRITPIHPEISNALAEENIAPCEIEFTIYSPDSPQGRTETWTVTNVDISDVSFEGFNAENSETHPLLEAFYESLSQDEQQGEIQEDVQIEDLLEVLDDVGEEVGEETGEEETTSVSVELDGDQPWPSPLDFKTWMDEAIAEDDFARAALLALQETHHFGPCPEQVIGSIRQACITSTSLPQLAEEDDAFEQVTVALAANLAGNHERSAGLIHDFLTHEDETGSAVRILFATSLLAWGPESLTAYPEADPIKTLGQALEEDPFATDGYWYLGQALLQSRNYDLAWLVFDQGATFIDQRPDAHMNLIGELEAQIETLAPGYFPVLAPRSE